MEVLAVRRCLLVLSDPQPDSMLGEVVQACNVNETMVDAYAYLRVYRD